MKSTCSRLRGRRAVSLPGAVITMAAGILMTAAPAIADALICRLYPDLSVEVDGSYPPDALFYQTNVQGKWYVDIPTCKNGLLVDMSQKKILAVPREQVSKGDGGLRINNELPSSAPAYAFSLEGPVIQFKAEDKKVRILPVTARPPIIGEVSFDDLIKDRGEYRAGMKAYFPDPKSIATINKYEKAVQIDAFFGTWCSHCKAYMPRFLRVVQEIKNPRIKVNLYGVPKNFGTVSGPWQGRGVQSIPAIILKVEGREISRLGSTPESVPEAELAQTLAVVH
jgi:thiol-disulfide isomerase/thioredoxin